MTLLNLEDSLLRNYVLLNAGCLNNWTQFKDELLNTHRAQLAISQGPISMDSGTMSKAASKGGSKCSFCGKARHTVVVCCARAGGKGGGGQKVNKSKTGKYGKPDANAADGGGKNGGANTNTSSPAF